MGEPDWKGYRKKPLEIIAYQTSESVDIPTDRGVVRAEPGDYIIRGIEGEIYPCAQSVFEKSYEPMELGPFDRLALRLGGTRAKDLNQ